MTEDRFDKYRKVLGTDKVDDFLAAHGLGPKYVPKKPLTYICPSCEGKNATVKERHADTDMNCMVLHCPDCGYEQER